MSDGSDSSESTSNEGNPSDNGTTNQNNDKNSIIEDDLVLELDTMNTLPEKGEKILRNGLL